MTEGEKLELKNKIKKVMVDHLTASVGYPKCSNEQIIGQLKNMWIKLEEAQLIAPEMKFQAFIEHAHQRLMMEEMKNILGI